MFGIFKKKTELEKLQEKYKTLMEESFQLSKTDRVAGDKKYAEAEALVPKIEALKKENK